MDYGEVQYESRGYSLQENPKMTGRLLPAPLVNFLQVRAGEQFDFEMQAAAIDADENEVTVYWVFSAIEGVEWGFDDFDYSMIHRIELATPLRKKFIITLDLEDRTPHYNWIEDTVALETVIHERLSQSATVHDISIEEANEQNDTVLLKVTGREQYLIELALSQFADRAQSHSESKPNYSSQSRVQEAKALYHKVMHANSNQI